MEKESKKILIVEDEPKVLKFIKQGLEENNYTVDMAYDGKIGLKLATANFYDLIILDVIIPYINGLELCSQIRQHNKQVKIIMLTALGSIEDKLEGFESGADDYLIKPFNFLELLARIKSLTKRNEHNSQEHFQIEKPNDEHIIKVADLEINLDNKRAKRDKKEIVLTGKEYLLLELLAVNKNRVVSKAEIAEKVWDITFDTGTNVIEVYINFLRNKIDKNFEIKLIHTVVGLGYILKDE